MTFCEVTRWRDETRPSDINEKDQCDEYYYHRRRHTPREEEEEEVEALRRDQLYVFGFTELLSAIARESKHLAGEIVEKKNAECRVLRVRSGRRARCIRSGPRSNFIVGGLIAVILSIELALAFDASVVFLPDRCA